LVGGATFSLPGLFLSKNAIIMKKVKISIPKIFIVALVFAASILTVSAQDKVKTVFEFPKLPYPYNALAPNIDSTTMAIHYSKHYRTYYDKFLVAIAGTEYEYQSLNKIFSNISKAPVAVRNMAGGYYNHNLFFENLSPIPGVPSDKLKSAIEARFGSFDAFKEAFNKAASGVFGSGWAWLIVTPGETLEIVSTPNQDNPLMDVVPIKGTPILTLDVWEHAYYLKYQNKRADYITAFWNVINWSKVSQRYENAMRD
jgi:superoxide dismutase, Fe-Mn family